MGPLISPSGALSELANSLGEIEFARRFGAASQPATITRQVLGPALLETTDPRTSSRSSFLESFCGDLYPKIRD
jgi:hypothetical protein